MQPGAVADIILIDHAGVKDNADWKAGMNSLPSEDFPCAVVNGMIAARDSRVLKGIYPGRPVRNTAIK